MTEESATPPEAQPAADLSPAETSEPGEPANAPAAQWPGPLRYGAGVVLIAIVAAGFVLVLPLLQIILLSFLIAFIMFMPSRALSGRTRLPYRLSVVLSFLIAAAIVVGLALLLLPDLRQLLGSFIAAIQQTYTQLAASQDNPALNTIVQIAGVSLSASDLASLLQRILPADAAGALNSLAHVLFGFFGNMAGLIAAVGTASVVALFFLIDLPISGGAMTNLVPRQYGREIALLFGKLDVLWLKFFRALIIIGVITGAASLGLFALFGINGALLLAVVTATIGLIPVVGRILAILMIFAAALVNGSTRFTGLDNFTFAILTIIAYLVVTQAIGTIVSPKLKGSAINVPTVAIVIGVMVGLLAAGIVGALLITPIIGSLRLFMQYALDKILLRDPYPGEPMPALQSEGFFSHMLYVKKKKVEAADDEP